MSTISPSLVAAAMSHLSGIVNRTPIIASRSLNQTVHNQVFLKCENFQRVGAFKFRGAYNAISHLGPEQKAKGVIAHSSGNHAQGVALAAKLLGVQATIVMPEDAPRIKREATAGYGAQIIQCPAIERETVSERLAQEHGYTLIHPYDNENLIAGAGTAAWEFFEDIGELDYLFVPVGGGGLISGSALAAAALSPHCQVIGVEPETGNDANISWRSGQIHALDHVPTTIADGLRTRFIGERNLAVMRRYVSDMLTASDKAIVKTLYYLYTRLKIVVEPSSAIALAPLFTGQYAVKNKKIGILISGGNVDVANLPFEDFPAKSKPLVQAAASPPIPDQPAILVCAPLKQEALEILQAAAQVDFLSNPSSDTLQERIGQYEAIIVNAKTKITGQLIEYGYKLKAIGALGNRLDNVDVSAARAFDLQVCYAPHSNAVAVAEHTLSRMLLLASREAGLNSGLAGKTLGLIGFGRIGRQVAQRALAFDMKVIVNQPRLTPELALDAGVQAADLHDLLQQADFVSLHVPFKAETQTIIGEVEIGRMKPSAYLINTAHTNLIDDTALLKALDSGRLAGASLATYQPDPTHQHPIPALQQHPKVIPAQHVTAFISDSSVDTEVTVAQQIVALLQVKRPSETLSLEVVPMELVRPHEQIDDKRVSRLQQSLAQEGLLVNPPLVTEWKGQYIVLDGATRSTALKRLGYPFAVVQIVNPMRDDFALHTWYHAISSQQTFTDLQQHLGQIEHLRLESLPTESIPAVFQQENTLCYFLTRDGQAILAQTNQQADKLTVMNALVASYTAWGDVERTLLTDRTRLLGQFPQMVAVAIFPQFKPEAVLEAASRGELLPAGLTRFLIPGRILRLNVDLNRLKQDEPLAAKRAWFNDFLAKKLARSRLRYYQEPVVLLDE